MAAMRYHQSGCVIGISTLALPSCVVSPTLARLVRVWCCAVAYGVFRVASRSGGTLILDRLLGLLCVKGDMGNSLTLFKSKFILLLDIIIIANITT